MRVAARAFGFPLAGAIAVLVGAAAPARAQLKDCAAFNPQRATALPDAQHAGAYTMFLDDIVRRDRAAGVPSAEQASLSALIGQAHAAFHRARGDGPAPSAEWKTCLGRAPKLGDFALRIRRDLFQYGVVLEVFGDSDGRQLALRHAIIPAMYEQNDEILQLDTVPLGDDVEDAAAAIDRYRAHLQGYIEVAMALRLILAVGDSPDQRVQRQTARRWLCDGVRLIFGGGGRPPAQLAPEQSALLDTLSRHMSDVATSRSYDDVRALLHHGQGAPPGDAATLLKDACLGARS